MPVMMKTDAKVPTVADMNALHGIPFPCISSRMSTQSLANSGTRIPTLTSARIPKILKKYSDTREDQVHQNCSVVVGDCSVQKKGMRYKIDDSNG